MSSGSSYVSVFIETKIGNPRSGFIPVGDVRGRKHSAEPLEGAICIRVHGEPFLDETYWDDVDSLWFYTVDELWRFGSQDEVKVRFPDQPLELILRRFKGGNIDLRVISEEITISRAIVQESEAIPAFCVAGIEFFNHLDRIFSGQHQLSEERAARLGEVFDRYHRKIR